MYATQQDIIDRYGEETLLIVADADLDDEIDAGKVQRALQDASDEIDSHIGKRYALPLEQTPRILVRLAVDIALYRLSPQDGHTEEKRKRYEDAVKVLKNIATGDISLGLDADTSEGASPTGMEVEVDSQDRLFNRGTMNRVL